MAKHQQTGLTEVVDLGWVSDLHDIPCVPPYPLACCWASEVWAVGKPEMMPNKRDRLDVAQSWRGIGKRMLHPSLWTMWSPWLLLLWFWGKAEEGTAVAQLDWVGFIWMFSLLRLRVMRLVCSFWFSSVWATSGSLTSASAVVQIWKQFQDPVPDKAAPDRCAQCAERMGRREADSKGAMNTSDRSELGCLQDAASSGHRAGEESPRLGSRRPCSADRRQTYPDMEAAGRAPMEVKKHQHKHNLKHRYEVMETLGKGTYGKVKKAVERASLKTVSVRMNMMWNVYIYTAAVCVSFQNIQHAGWNEGNRLQVNGRDDKHVCENIWPLILWPSDAHAFVSSKSSYMEMGLSSWVA